MKRRRLFWRGLSTARRAPKVLILHSCVESILAFLPQNMFCNFADAGGHRHRRYADFQSAFSVHLFRAVSSAEWLAVAVFSVRFPPEPLCRSALRRLLFSFLHVSVFYVSYSAASEAVIDSEAEVPSNLAVSSTTSLCFVSISVSHLARFLPLQRRWRRR